MNDRLAELKRAYEQTPVPPELYRMVRTLCRQEQLRFRFWRPVAVLAAVLILFMAVINTMPAMAESLERLPVVGPIVRVFTFARYRLEEQGVRTDIKVAQITGLENKELEAAINAELLADGQALVEQFARDVADLKARFGGQDAIHIAIETYYAVKCSNAEVFSLQVEFFWAAGGSDTFFKCYNVNQRTGALMTLDTLFVDGSDYLTVINGYLTSQMKAETREDGKSIYWVNPDDAEPDRFSGIDSKHTFFVNEDSHLVILFDKYEVAPGYVGTPEFEIPTELLADMLADDAPIH